MTSNCSSEKPSETINNTLAICLLLISFALAPESSHAQVEISEFMASNEETLFDEDGDASDWIEIKNISASSVNLDGWYLTDDDQSLTKWEFPSTVIPPNSFIVVFASNKERANSGGELHTNFKLKGSGEYLALVAADASTVVSEYAPEYPQQFDDISYGGNSYFLQATPGAENSVGVAGFAGAVEFDLPHGIYETPQALSLSSDLPSGEIRYTLNGSEPSIEFGCTPPADGKSWSYNYYEGSWQSLPNFDLLTAVESGTTDTISAVPSLTQNTDNFGLRFNGCIQALTDGYYTFSTTSDEGSRLYVDNQLVVDNDGLHTEQTVANQIFLAKGLHTVKVDYFDATGTQTLSADWVAPLRGQTYLTTPNDGQVYGPSSSSTDFIEFEIDVPADGEFRFVARVQGVDAGSDSFWVQLNNQAFWQFEIGQPTSFNNVTLNNLGTDITATLTAGEHSLRFYPREDGAHIDSLKIETISCDGPCADQTLQAEIESVSGIYLMAGLNQEALPATSWFNYSTSIPIDKTTIVRAVAVQPQYLPSSISTNTYLFFDDIVLQSRAEQTPEGWPVVDPNMQDMDYGMDPDIVDPDAAAIKESLASLPSISIVTDIDNLLHPNFGIYVNAEEKGRYWERPVHVELLDDSGAEPGFSIDAGIRVRGGFSRRKENPKHPFRLFFRGSYGGDLDYPMFEDEGTDSFEKLDLRSPNNYSWAFSGDPRNTLLREVWSRDTQKALGHPYTRSRYYHMYINGQYWGITMTQERVSKEYAKSYFGGKKSDYDIVKHDRQNDFRFEASDGSNNAWNQIWTAVSDQSITPAEYAALEQQVDFDNLIDYAIGNGFEGDIDGSASWFINRWKRSNNWYAVRDRSGTGLKWSFFQHDGEHTLGVRRDPSAEENVLGPFSPFDGTLNQFFNNDFMNPYWLHQALVSNIDYRQRVIDRVDELFSTGGILSNEQGLVRWNERKAQVGPAILAHSARWADSKRATPYTVTDWQAEVSYVENTFFADRAQVVFEQLLNLGLATDIPTPDVSIASGTVVDEGELVFITNTSSGAIYYTTDGSDPRAPGGGVSPNAILLMPGQSIEITEDTLLTIRVFDAGNWSAPTTANYTVIVEEPETCYVIPAKNGKTVVFCL